MSSPALVFEGPGSAPAPEHDQPSSPEIGILPRMNPSVTRVNLDYFDPEGVQGLKEELSTQQIPADDARSEAQSSTSDVTITVDGNFNLEKTLQRVVKRLDEANIKTRELGVMFRDLRVLGLGSSASYMPTLGSALNPFVMLENIQNIRHPPLQTILSEFEGVVRPGEMLLVLGRPGSGCTTFLKTLANRRSEYYAVEGDVHYDSISPSELQNHYRGDVQYCPEDDIHFPTLTVNQTLKFAATTRTPRERINKTRSQFAQKETDILTTIFGLKHAKDTPVGDAAIRGVSGGEKKRVSIAEALATRARIGCWDNSTRGLDSSTALEFVRALRLSTDTFHLTTMATIYQAGESLYQHFDKVCVIYEGQMAYFGPADQARQYFIDMG
ncbi:hypothetical protein AX15_006135 [Amanita polypyramis BW_CC]|nr:hypothetical protein AX15_006135 [Amanita polypyramis BW_CC]